MPATIRSRIFFAFAIRNIKIKINIAIVLPFVVDVCEVWSLTLREKHRLTSDQELDAEKNISG
jgi:hypothetical protein